MKLRLRESDLCVNHAERAIRLREEKSGKEIKDRPFYAAIIEEGKVVAEALASMNLTESEKVEYVANNSVTIKAEDGHEGIQIIWINSHAICVHRLLSREFRAEFGSHWLGVWAEKLDGESREHLERTMSEKVAYRVEQRRVSGVNGELNFAASPAYHVINEHRI